MMVSNVIVPMHQALKCPWIVRDVPWLKMNKWKLPFSFFCPAKLHQLFNWSGLIGKYKILSPAWIKVSCESKLCAQGTLLCDTKVTLLLCISSENQTRVEWNSNDQKKHNWKLIRWSNKPWVEGTANYMNMRNFNTTWDTRLGGIS